MRIVTHSAAARQLRAGHAVTIRRRGEQLRLDPPSGRSGPRRSWSGWGLVLVDGLPTVVSVHTLEPGYSATVTLPQPGLGGRLYSWRTEDVPWERVLGLGCEWRVEDFIV